MRNSFVFEAEPFEFDEYEEKLDIKLADETWQGEVNRSSRDYVRWTLTRGEVTLVVLLPTADSALTYGMASTRPVTLVKVQTPSGTFTFILPVVYFSVVEAADADPSTNPIRALTAGCYELCHAFFDLSDRYGPTTGTGPYEIISNAPHVVFSHMNIHAKMIIGWIQPKIIRGHIGRCLAFPASKSTKAAVLVMSPETPQAPLKADEYWIVENRHKPSSAGHFDDGLPKSSLPIWWVKTGEFPNSHDDVRLVNFSKPDQNPNNYQNPGPSALFMRNDAKPTRHLVNGSGRPSFAWLRGISPVGATMYAEFC
jgi:hypothetical protein